jgi:hypothetical protein
MPINNQTCWLINRWLIADQLLWGVPGKISNVTFSPVTPPQKGSSEFSLPDHSEIGLCIADSPWQISTRSHQFFKNSDASIDYLLRRFLFETINFFVLLNIRSHSINNNTQEASYGQSVVWNWAYSVRYERASTVYIHLWQTLICLFCKRGSISTYPTIVSYINILLIY